MTVSEYSILAVVMVLLTSCSMFQGLQKPTSMTQDLSYVAGQVTALNNSTTELLKAGVMGLSTAKNIRDITVGAEAIIRDTKTLIDLKTTVANTEAKSNIRLVRDLLRKANKLTKGSDPQ